MGWFRKTSLKKKKKVRFSGDNSRAGAGQQAGLAAQPAGVSSTGRRTQEAEGWGQGGAASRSAKDERAGQ